MFDKFHPEKHYGQLFFPQKKNFVWVPKMVVFPYWDRTWDLYRELKIFFLKI